MKKLLILIVILMSTSANALTTSVSYVVKKSKYMHRSYHFGKNAGPNPGVTPTSYYERGLNISLQKNLANNYILGIDSDFTHYSNEAYLKLGYEMANEDVSLTPSLLGIYVDHHYAGYKIARKLGIGVQAQVIVKQDDVFDFMLTPRIKETYFTQMEAEIGMRAAPFINKNHKIIASITGTHNPSNLIETVRLQSAWVLKFGFQTKF